MPQPTTHPAELKQQLGSASSLLDALDAVSEWRAFALLSCTVVLTMLLAALFGAITAFFAGQSGVLAAVTGFVGFLATAFAGLVGLNATGIWLSDSVWGRTQRSMMDAVIAAAFSVHRLLAVMTIEFLLFLVFLIGLTLLLFLCKIPGIGPLLYAAVMPLGVIASGVVLFALIYIAIPLASPAVWNGMPVMRTVVMLQEVARHRMLKAVLMMILLGLMMMLVVGFVWAVLGIGALVVASLSAAVIGIHGGGMSSIMSMFTGGAGGSNGYLYAMGFGGAVLLLIGANPGMLIALKGASIIYREVSQGLSLDNAEQAISARMADLKSRAEAARAQAMAHAQQTTASPATALACGACNAPATAQDVFCGSCGHKMK